MDKITEFVMSGLSQSEYDELIFLEYILTWGYSKNPIEDELRFAELSDKKWSWRELNKEKFNHKIK